MTTAPNNPERKWLIRYLLVILSLLLNIILMYLLTQYYE